MMIFTCPATYSLVLASFLPSFPPSFSCFLLSTFSHTLEKKERLQLIFFLSCTDYCAPAFTMPPSLCLKVYLQVVLFIIRFFPLLTIDYSFIIFLILLWIFSLQFFKIISKISSVIRLKSLHLSTSDPLWSYNGIHSDCPLSTNCCLPWRSFVITCVVLYLWH